MFKNIFHDSSYNFVATVRAWVEQLDYRNQELCLSQTI